MALRTIVPLSSAATTAYVTAGSSDDARKRDLRAPAVLQAVISGVATITVQASLDGTNWLTIKTYTASAIEEIPQYPFLRAQVSAWTSGTAGLLMDGPIELAA